MAIRKLRESNNLSNIEICNILVDYGFGNEEEGYLDYFLDNPKYCASVNLDDMGSYVDDYDEGEHVELPYANGADRKILRTREDVDEFLDFIADLENEKYLESKERKTGKRITENSDVDDAVMNDVLKKVKKFGIKCDELAELMASVYYIIKYDTRTLVSFTPDKAERICAELDKLCDILDTNVKIPDDLYDLIDEIPSSSKIGQGYDVFY